MAIVKASSNFKPLDPMASPYHKIPPRDLYICKIPETPTYYRIFPPPVIQFSAFYSYNVHFQPVTRKPFSLPPPPSPEKKTTLSLAPVPSGPRIPKTRLYRRYRRANKVGGLGKFGGGGNELKKPQWKAVENKSTSEKQAGCGGGKRWKNRSAEYHKNLPLETKTTSVMIKNIPNKYTRKLLIKTLDNHCKLENQKIKKNSIDDKSFVSAYDFLYLPIDFHRRVNAGFAFVNFTTPEAASKFKDAFHGKHWEFFGSPKIAEITRARIQGKMSLMNNCKTLDFTYGYQEDMPVAFEPARDGSDPVRSKMTILGKYFH